MVARPEGAEDPDRRATPPGPTGLHRLPRGPAAGGGDDHRRGWVGPRPGRGTGRRPRLGAVTTAVWIVVFGALLVAGAWFGVRYMNERNGCVKSPVTGRCAETQFSP